jgi:mannose-1-phosphate guanylyltransferase
LFKKYQPAMYQVCVETVELMINQADLAEIKKSYARAEKMSIESAITDKAPALAMSVSDRIGWSDLGKWHIIKRMLSNDSLDNLVKGKVIINKSQDNLVYNTVDKKVVVINDIRGLAIIDTPDALYISSLINSADIKECLEQVKEKGWEEYL